jgi:hypothetical protein
MQYDDNAGHSLGIIIDTGGNTIESSGAFVFVLELKLSSGVTRLAISAVPQKLNEFTFVLANDFFNCLVLTIGEFKFEEFFSSFVGDYQLAEFFDNHGIADAVYYGFGVLFLPLGKLYLDLQVFDFVLEFACPTGIIFQTGTDSLVEFFC